MGSKISMFICCIVGIPVLIILIVLLNGKDDVFWNLKRWYDISNTQKERSIRQICGHILLIFLVLLIAFLLSTWIDSGNLGTLLNVSYKNSDTEVIPVTTMSTTVFATLMTVLLALIALAVTAYVFLNDALSNRDNYEKGVIQTLKSRTRWRLFINCLLSGVCIALCLVVDNTSLAFGSYLKIARYGVVIVSAFEILCLILYINVIVNYERHLLEYARSYIEFNQCALCMIKRQRRRKKQLDLYSSDSSVIADVIKKIGDVENIVNSILRHHESEFRYQHEMTSDAMLQSILNNKVEEKQLSIQKKDIERICGRYKRLLEIRNCLWVMQDYGEDINVLLKLPNLSMELTNTIKQYAFRRESFPDLSFYDIDFSRSDFFQSSMRGSALQCVNLNKADLRNCDFSDGLLQNVDLRGADCSGAIFSGARIVSPVIDEKTKFENAVFGEAEFTFENSQCFCKTVPDVTEDYLYCFKAVSGRRANFIGGRLSCMTFERAALPGAQFDNSELNRCNFQWADLSEAILTMAAIRGNNDFTHVNCSNLTAVYSSWGDMSGKKEQKMDLTGSRFARANLAGSVMANCNFRKAYINDASFTGAKLTWCKFREALLTNTDFTDASISQCDFTGTILMNALFVGDMESQRIEGDTIDDVLFTDAEMNGCSIKNHTFTNCSFKNAILDHVIIRNVKFIGCAFHHAHIDHALLFNVTWENCSGRIETQEEDIDFGTFEDRKQWLEAFLSN